MAKNKIIKKLILFIVGKSLSDGKKTFENSQVLENFPSDVIEHQYYTATLFANIISTFLFFLILSTHKIRFVTLGMDFQIHSFCTCQHSGHATQFFSRNLNFYAQFILIG
jgi:hypothetical protein